MDRQNLPHERRDSPRRLEKEERPKKNQPRLGYVKVVLPESRDQHLQTGALIYGTALASTRLRREQRERRVCFQTCSIHRRFPCWSKW